MNSESRTFTIVLALVAGLLAVGVVIVFDQVDHLAVWVFALLILLMGVVPIGMQWARGKVDLFEAFNAYWLLYFLCFGAGSLFVLYVKTVAADPGIFDWLDLAAAYCTIGFAFTVLGYYLTGSVVPARTQGPGASMGWIITAVLYLIGSGGQFTFAFLERLPASIRIMFLTGGMSLLSQLDFFAFFALFYVCFLFFSKQATAGYKFVLFGIMVPTQLFSLFLRFGNKTPLFLALAMPIMAYWYARRRLAWKTILVVGAVSVIFIFPLYYTVRNIKSVHYSQSHRIERTLETLSQEKADVFARDALRTTARRFAVVNSTAAILRDCGTRVEYAWGRTIWRGVFSTLVPRIFWPNKPTTTIGVEVGKTFRVTGFGDNSSIAPTAIGELYWNFHVPGIVVGMFLIGVWLRVLYLRFGANLGANPLRLSMYVTLLYSTLVILDGGLGGMPGLMLRQVVIYIVLEKCLYLLEMVGHRGRSALGGEAAFAES